MEHTIKTTLKNLGISPAWNGYTYLTEAIKLVIEDSSLAKGRMTTVVYPQAAKLTGKRYTQVERSIRFAIEAGWLRGSQALQQTIFGYSVSLETGKPTCKEFIVAVAEYIKEEMHGSK